MSERVTKSRESVVASATEDDRSFEARYGKLIVSRSIATIPALVLRWQARLGLKDEHVVTIANILCYRSSPPAWPSVSIEKMAEWRGVSWPRVNKTLKDLERLGYLIRRGRDPKHRRSYVFDLTPLLTRLTNIATTEAEQERLRKEANRLGASAAFGLSTDPTANREQQQSTAAEESVEDPTGSSYRVR